ncbi:hypothetical protein LOC67_11795 [Stieleria sp. JC731]|uniref:hypothetical protein n=1 Tax=Pirellulaceae TaxID=2691357 RepID=UPI001E3BF694|nr:hypothetical protein [Stieleria sp. JC731]MCC9601230.1 hypothetical protein [Stieleria sp. JC731]
MLADPGLWYIHEPFNPNKGFWPDEFSYVPSGESSPEVDTYFSGLLSGRYRGTSLYPNTDLPWMPLRLIRPPIRRVLIKDPLACLLSPYLADRFKLRTVVLFRHPAGFVASVLRLGWPIAKFIQQFLSNDGLMADHLSRHSELLTKHQFGSDAPAAAVLHGSLNTVLWNLIQKRPGTDWYRFEDLCENPIARFQQVFATLGLPYTEHTRLRHESLCFRGDSDPASYHPHSVRRLSLAMGTSWKDELTSNQVNQIRDIWEQFEIPLYQGLDDWYRVAQKPSAVNP